MAASRGIIESYNENTGRGFILPEDGQRHVYFSRSDLADQHNLPRQGDGVDYKPLFTPSGPCAVQVVIIKRAHQISPAPDLKVASVRQLGHVLSFDGPKGFGFIKPDTGTLHGIFFHFTGLLDQTTRPSDGDQVSFEIGPGTQGRLKAIKIKIEQVSTQAVRRSRRAS